MAPDRRSTTRHTPYDFEHVSRPLAPLPVYFRRQLRSLVIGLVLVLLSLLAGMWGYHALVKLPWIDAFLNAAMILGGMGPMAAPTTQAGKVFAGVYALYSGIAVIAIAGVIAAPLVHRFLHRLHADAEKSQ